jgi:hypothetical protein
MALADPQSLTVNGSAKSLPRVGMTDTSGRFLSADGKYLLDIQHTFDKKFRHKLEFKFVDTVANPLVPDVNMVATTRTYLVIENPVNGIDTVTAGYVAAALTTFANAALITKLLGGES